MDIVLPLLTLVAGTFFGLLTSLYIAYLQHKRDINMKIIEQYLEVSGQLCDELSVLATLQIAYNQEMPSLHEHIEILEKLFYKYFRFLPSEVLIEILCLEECLRDNGNNLYKQEDNCLHLMEETDFKAFFERISLLDNFKYYAPILLKSKDPYVRRIAAINYQARSVLASINRYFTIQNLASWNRHLSKSRKKESVLFNTAQKRHLLLQERNSSSKTSKELHVDNIESHVSTIMASLLNMDSKEMKPNNNFFEYGGDSILAIQLAARIRKDFNTRLPALVVFTSPTPHLLAAEIERLMLDQLKG